MDLDELQRNIMRIRDLEEMESRPSNPYNPSDGMSTDEMRKFIQFIFDQIRQSFAMPITPLQEMLKNKNARMRRFCL